MEQQVIDAGSEGQGSGDFVKEQQSVMNVVVLWVVISVLDESEQQAFEQAPTLQASDATPDEDFNPVELAVIPQRDEPTSRKADGPKARVDLMLLAGEHFPGPVIIGFVGCLSQQEGSPILSISVQRHSARSRAAFHRRKDF